MGETKFCDHCERECKEILYDDSFSYPGTTRNRMETHHEYHPASDCCEASCTDGTFVMCKCGNEVELHPDTELELKQCKVCKRVGSWLTEY